MLSSWNLFSNEFALPSWVGGFNGEHSLLWIFIPNAGWPMLFGFCWFIYFYIVFMRHEATSKGTDLAEGFDPYTSSLQIYDKKNLIEEEIHNREANKLPLLPDLFFQKLQKKMEEVPLKFTIQNVVNYDILQNPIY